MSLERASLTAAERALERQERSLDELRGRSGTLIAAASLVVSFLGAEALSSPSGSGRWVPVILGLVALGAFLVILVATVFVLIPRARGFTFGVSGTALYEQLFNFRHDQDEIDRRLTYELSAYWKDNDALMQQMFAAFKLGAFALFIEVLSLTAVIAIRMF